MLNQVCKILVGNKCDKSSKCVSEEDARNLCKENNMVYFETSAKTDINVNKVFELMARQVLDNINIDHIYTKGLSINLNKQKEKYHC